MSNHPITNRPITNLWQSLLDLVFPPKCVGCGRPGSLLCDPCLQAAPRVQPPFCKKCGKPLALSTEDRVPHTGSLCSFCREAHLFISGIRSPYVFEGAVRKSIHSFKYRGMSSLSPTLGHLLAEYLSSHRLPVDVVVPVPLHPRRRKERGYDQAELLAGQLASELSLPLGKGWLARSRPTLPQVDTSNAAQRWQNVHGAFAAAAAVDPGRSVLLVDDVCTTGATLEACTRALRQAGTSVVWGLTLAREA